MVIHVLIISDDFEKWIRKFRESFNKNKAILKCNDSKCIMSVGNDKMKIIFTILHNASLNEMRGRRVSYVVLDKVISEEEEHSIGVAMIGNNIHRTEKWREEEYNESKY